MKELIKNLPLLILPLIFSCNKEFPDAKKKVEIIKIKEETTLPGEVSIFFQVVDKKNATPIAGLENDDFIIYEQGPNDKGYDEISQFEANSSIVLDNQNFIFSTMLVLDLSPSIMGDLEQLKTSATTFINEFIPDENSGTTQMGIWWFDGDENLHELTNFTTSKSDLKLAINSINSDLPQDPSTNLYGAVVQSSNIAKLNNDTFNSQGIINSSAIVIFTDGTDQAAWNTTEEAIESTATNTKFLTIGLGGEIDKKVLKEIGSSGFGFSKDVSKLNETFSKIANRVSDEANSYYLFKYCSPKRNGNNIKLKLEIDGKIEKKKHKGEIETTFDATGFSGC